MPAGKAFHPRFATSSDLILGIVAQEKVCIDRIGYVRKVKSSVGTTIIRDGIVSMRRIAHIAIPIVIFVVPVHTTPYQIRIVISDRKKCPFNP